MDEGAPATVLCVIFSFVCYTAVAMGLSSIDAGRVQLSMYLVAPKTNANHPNISHTFQNMMSSYPALAALAST